jgi:DNA-binding MarR family transcriptional regulator
MNEKFDESLHLEYLLEITIFFGRLLRNAGGLSKTNAIRYYILKILEQKREASLTEISDVLFFKKSSLSQLLDRMVNDSLIDRRPDTVDRRKIILSITPKGFDAKTEFEQTFFSNLQKYALNFPGDDGKEFMKSIGAVVRILRRNQGAIDNYFANYSNEPED